MQSTVKYSDNDTGALVVKKFSYKWHSRFLWISWVFGYFLLGTGVSIWTQVYQTQPEMGELFFLWSILFVLIAITVLLGWRIMVILCPLEVMEGGIIGGFRSDGFEFLPKSNTGLIKWPNIEGLELFSFPDMDSLKMGKKSGFRLISGNKKIVVYEHIQKYGELLSGIRAELNKNSN